MMVATWSTMASTAGALSSIDETAVPTKTENTTICRISLRAMASTIELGTRWVTNSLSVSFDASTAPPPPLAVALRGDEALETGFDVLVPAGADRLGWGVALEVDGKEMDRLRVSQRVVPAVPVQVLQGTVAQLDPALRIPVERPAGALPGAGGVTVGVRAKLADGLEGVADHLRDYPFGCLEQKASRAVGLRDAAAWQQLMAELPGFLEFAALAVVLLLDEPG